MPGDVTLFSDDQTWKVQVSSFKTSLFFYNAIGTAVDVFHKEQVGGNIWGAQPHLDWVAKAASAISITNTYSGGVVGAQVGTQSHVDRNASHSELKIWEVGMSLSFDATADTGGPADPNLPGGAPSFQVNAVVGTVNVSLPGQAKTLSARTNAP